MVLEIVCLSNNQPSQMPTKQQTCYIYLRSAHFLEPKPLILFFLSFWKENLVYVERRYFIIAKKVRYSVIFGSEWGRKTLSPSELLLLITFKSYGNFEEVQSIWQYNGGIEHTHTRQWIDKNLSVARLK